MLHFKTIFNVLGTLLFIEAFLMILCLAVAFYYGEEDTLAFIISILTTLCAAFVMKNAGRDSDNTLSRRDAYLLVTLTWVVFSFFGTLPFLIGGFLDNFTDAYFETMSGFTTTGASVIDDVTEMPRGILFWRSLSQWIGGLGIVFFTIALLPSMVGGSVRVFAAEATGPLRAKLHPRLSTNAKWLWSIYIFLTLACIGSFFLCGMTWYEALNYAMTSTATGGFAIHNDGLGHFHCASVEYVCTLFCFLSGVNFTLLYFTVSRLSPRELLRNAEFRFYGIVTLLCTVFVMALLLATGNYGVEHAFRSAIFQVVSFITSTGLFNEDVAQWPVAAVIVLVACMVIGASSGSTSSGIKSIRAVMLLKIAQNEFRQILHPNAVLPLRLNGQNIPQQKRVTLLAFLTIFMLLCGLMFTLLMAFDIGTVNSVKITLSCICNVGPSLDTGVGPNISWSSLPTLVKWACSAMMLIGRLEIFSVLIIFTRAFWKEN